MNTHIEKEQEQEDIIMFPSHYHEEEPSYHPFLDSAFQFRTESEIENMSSEEYEAYNAAYEEHIHQYCDYVNSYDDPDYNVHGYAIEDTYPMVPPGLGIETSSSLSLTQNLENDNDFMNWLTNVNHNETYSGLFNEDEYEYEDISILEQTRLSCETSVKKICNIYLLELPIDVLEMIIEFTFMKPEIYKQKKYKLYIQENFIKSGKFMNDLVIQDHDGVVFCDWYFGSYHPKSCQIHCLFCMNCGEYVGTRHNRLRRLCRCAPLLVQ